MDGQPPEFFCFIFEFHAVSYSVSYSRKKSVSLSKSFYHSNSFKTTGSRKKSIHLHYFTLRLAWFSMQFNKACAQEKSQNLHDQGVKSYCVSSCLQNLVSDFESESESESECETVERIVLFLPCLFYIYIRYYTIYSIYIMYWYGTKFRVLALLEIDA